MSKKKIENIETETKNEKFKRVSNPRIKKLVYEINRLTGMCKSPVYSIYDVDAQKILDYVTKSYNAFFDVYTKLASGQEIKSESKKELEDVF